MIVTEVDSDGKRVTTSDGETVSYNHLVLASGGKPKRIPIDDKDLEGVLMLRHVGDAKTINSLVSKDSNIVIIGTGFIEMESRGALIKKETKSVTLVGMDELPFEAIETTYTTWPSAQLRRPRSHLP